MSKQLAKLVSKGKHKNFYEVESEETYSVIYDKNRDSWCCTCVHGSNRFKGICWHIRESMKVKK